jgi:hypothetical protein
MDALSRIYRGGRDGDHSFKAGRAAVPCEGGLMNRLSIATFVAGVFLACAPLANAQFGPENRYSPSQVSTLIDRVHEDLNQAYGARRFSDAERGRLNNAEKQLREFSQKWTNAKFDKGELDDAIGAIEHVLDNNRMPVGTRDALSDDVAQLRLMREAYDRHEIGY